MSIDTSSIIIKKTRTRTKRTLSPEEAEEKNCINEIKLDARKSKNVIVCREWRKEKKTN